MRRFPNPWRAAAALLLLGAAPAPPSPTASPAALIDVLERAMPLTRPKVLQLLPPPAGCGAGCEDYASRYRGLPVQDVDVRANPPLFVVVLRGIGGACTPVAALQRRYRADRVENGCTDGATCMAAYAPRPWGSLFFSLPANGDVRACAREIILNSDKRPR